MDVDRGNFRHLRYPNVFSAGDASGSASCPVVTGYVKLLLAEFDYDNRPTPSFPSIPRSSVTLLHGPPEETPPPFPLLARDAKGTGLRNRQDQSRGAFRLAHRLIILYHGGGRFTMDSGMLLWTSVPRTPAQGSMPLPSITHERAGTIE